MKYLRPFAALSLAALPVAVHKRQFHANRIFMPVRYESEFDNIALLPTPLLANFTLRGHSQSDQLTGAIIKILSYETEKSISAVDIETDEATTRPIMERYGISKIPTVLALKSGIPIGSYTLEKNQDLDWIDFKDWIEEMADK